MAGSVNISKARLNIKLWLKMILAIPGVFVRSRPPYTRVLFYHRINPYPFADLGAVSRELTVRPEHFEKQLRLLKRKGFRTLKLDEFQRIMSGADAVDPKAVLITFDDGYEDNLLWAAPLLNKFGYTAVVFVVSGFIGRTTAEVWPGSDPAGLGRFLDSGQIWQWKRAGLEVGSHTQTHPLLTSLPAHAQLEELVVSKQTLEEQFDMPVRSLAYPGGDFDHDAVKAALNAGYTLAFSTIPGVNRPKGALMAIRRTEVSASDNMLVFRAKISGLLDWLAFKESAWFRHFMGRINRFLIPIAQASRSSHE